MYIQGKIVLLSSFNGGITHQSQGLETYIKDLSSTSILAPYAFEENS